MRQTLIIDADDTLWENNIHFEEATDRFLRLVEQRGGDPGRGRDLLHEIERRNIPVHGYGTRGFTRSMMDTLEEMTGRPASASDRERILAFGHRVRHMPIQFLAGVTETLALLKQQHRLILFTKGDPPEQRDKVERSGASRYFHHVEVTPEKAPEDYLRIIELHEIEREHGWMVGNSPRSDVNPALEVGLGAVYIPHPSTWKLEHEEVRPSSNGRLEIIETFSQLLDLFFSRQR